MENSEKNLKAAYVAYTTVQAFKPGDIVRCKPWMCIYNRTGNFNVVIECIENPGPGMSAMKELEDIRIGVFDSEGNFLTFPVNSQRFELAE